MVTTDRRSILSVAAAIPMRVSMYRRYEALRWMQARLQQLVGASSRPDQRKRRRQLDPRRPRVGMDGTTCRARRGGEWRRRGWVSSGRSRTGRPRWRTGGGAPVESPLPSTGVTSRRSFMSSWGSRYLSPAAVGIGTGCGPFSILLPDRDWLRSLLHPPSLVPQHFPPAGSVYCIWSGLKSL